MNKPWEERLERKVERLRKDLSTEYKRGTVKPNNAKNILEKWECENPEKTIDATIEELKERIAPTAQRLQIYRKQSQQYLDNKLFNTDAKEKKLKKMKNTLNWEK